MWGARPSFVCVVRLTVRGGYREIHGFRAIGTAKS
jgi:hypothetical protein